MKDTKNKDLRRYLEDSPISAATIAGGLLALILHRFGVIDQNIVSDAILALVVLLATSQIVDKSKKLDELSLSISNSSRKILSAIGAINIRKFEGAKEGFDYLSRQIMSAQRSIDHAAFAPHIPRHSQASKKYEESIKTILQGDQVNYRYIAGLEPNKHRLNRITARLSDEAVQLYYPRYYDRSDTSLPGFSFVIIDEREIIAYYPGQVGELGTVFSTRYSDMVYIYCVYFRRLWGDSNEIDLGKAEQLLEKRSTQNS